MTRHELEQDLLSQGALAGSTVEFVRSISSRHSELFEYRVRSGIGTRAIIAKRQAPAPGVEQVTLQEFTNLERVRVALGQGGQQSVPEAILVLPQKGLLVTEKVPGISFTEILKTNANCLVGPFRGSLIRETSRWIGKWLRDFQSATRTEPVTFEADRFLAHLERHLSRCRERGVPADSAAALLRDAAARAGRLDRKSIPAAGRHGDFIPQNIMVLDQNRVAVVDWEGLRERQPIYDDLGMFLGYLAVLTARFRYSRSSLHAGAKAFLAGFLMGDPLDRDCANIYRLKGVVRILADGPPHKGAWERRSTSRLLAQLRQSNPFVL